MTATLAAAYERWARIEVRGISPIFHDWALDIASNPQALGLIDALPPSKRQPNLVFAAARLVGAPLGSASQSTQWLIEHWDRVLPEILNRSTQTNEAGRCAVLLPVLSRISGPMSLIEVGASAGLCLYPDKYSYRYATGTQTITLDPIDGASAVTFPCAIDADSVPTRLPEVAWRAGVDLNPLDISDPDQLTWLETLVWPEHEARRSRLHKAARIAAATPVPLVQGDLIEKLPALVSQAPADTEIVVFHSAVLVYLSQDRREEFVALMESMPQVTWISNEGQFVLPSITAQVTASIHEQTILSVNQRPIALVDPHGQSYQALDISR